MKRVKSRDHIFNLMRMINEYEETLARKRGEMTYLSRQSKKLQQRLIDYDTYNLHPIARSEEPNTTSESIRIDSNTKEPTHKV